MYNKLAAEIAKEYGVFKVNSWLFNCVVASNILLKNIILCTMP